MASALGMPMVIPIVIRTLTGSLAFVEETILPFNTCFLATLDSGEHQVINNYEFRWWSGRKPRDINTVEIMGGPTIKKCLIHYREEKAKGVFLPAGAGASRFAGTKPDGETMATASAKPTFARSGQTANIKDAGSGCRNCTKYKQLLSDVLQDVLKFQNYASAMSTSSENLLNIGIRKASNFQLLHEAAILKETAGIPPPTKGKTHQISAVASKELNRLKDLPPSSYKWTWGETLTEEEVLNLRRIGPHRGRVAHSGYDVSLPEGKPAGEYSEYSAGPSASLHLQHDLPADASYIPPSTDLQLPEYFSRPDHRRIYNPFRFSNSSITRENIVDDLAPDSPSPFKMAENWNSSTGSSPVNNPADIADRWTSGSEAGSVPELPDSPSPFNMAEKWNSEAGSVPEEPDSPSPFNMAEKWNSSSGSLPNNPAHIADIWTSGSEEGRNALDSKNAPAPALSLVESTTEKSADLNANDIHHLADLWVDDDGIFDDDSNEVFQQAELNVAPLPLPVDTPTGTPKDQNPVAELTVDDCFSPLSLPVNNLSGTVEDQVDQDPVALADRWAADDDDEHSGDDLANPSYSYEVSGGLSGADTPNNWTVSHEVSVLPGQTAPGQTASDWTYGPEHFEFLREEMFYSGSDEE